MKIAYNSSTIPKDIDMTQEISHKKIRQIIIINFVFLLIPITISAQTISQHGVAYQYNGKKERTPLGNVTISYETDKRTTISDEHDGTFILTLVGRKMGDRIGSVTIKKREMMVFNQHAVDEWSVRKDPLKLILCNTDEFERQKENLIEIVDYGCGQGLASLCYHDFIKEHYSLQKVKRITLIEPSPLALSRAELLCSCFYPDAEIVAVKA